MSIIGNVNASTPTSNTSNSGSGTSTSTGQTLTQQDFLQLMVAQFTQQDPLSDEGSGAGGSSSTTDYINQLLSMTNLATMQTMSSQMTTSSGQQAMQLASSLPGATVEVTGNGGTAAGVVQKARVSGSNLYLTINGQEYSGASLISIDQTAAQNAAAANSNSSGTPTP